jgi:hypothetical protein
MPILKLTKLTAIVAWVSVLMTGCATLSQSEIPYFISSLEKHSFSPEEKKSIAELLRYAARLEAE